jgi:hypothetical protein
VLGPDGRDPDCLVDLLIQLVHRINARAEQRVEGEMIANMRRVAGKQGILFRLAEAAVEHPDETVRRALYPVVGEGTLHDLVRDARANEGAFRRRVRTLLSSSYSSYYRPMLPKLPAPLEFRCNNTAFRPVMDGLELLRSYAGRERARWYDVAERVPIDGVVPAGWRDAVVDERGARGADPVRTLRAGRQLWIDLTRVIQAWETR